ncbi:uncharacterized protein TRIVIDRAFT_224543 [Trichoderma virens Gv29-8]|uniref:Uncharacterized protein n=1 Tax=Hypocrea virens (strain Gv29-8 / FGSC 10586) TaxID=413071 RepID=G9N0K1_HYPVG|nr:uncharacterized protein TRIVIDRAFT_224543 [Trichoderma virens Gv29-8]EHK19883.1 hypothetical protein TRIVIDRAFT_224543 [Trichoderma virens Gv29-8]
MATLTSDLGPASIVVLTAANGYIVNGLNDFGFRVNYALGNKWDCCLHWERRRDS